MKRRSLIFILSILLLTLSTSAISNYIIFGNDISGNSSDIIVNGSEDDSYTKVTFYGDNTNYLYVKKGETITIDDIPSSLNNSLIEWKKDSTSGDTILSVLNNGYSDGYVVTQDLNLYSSQIDLTGVMSPTNNEISKDENNPDDDGNINISGNTVKIEEGDNNRNTITEINIDKPIFNNSTIQSTFKDQDGNESLEQNIAVGSGEYQHTNDTTIGLEDPSSKETIEINEKEKFYKPNTNSGTVYNPCINRIKLDSDTSLLGGSTLNIGARVGYYNGGGWSQMNWQGFINGSYNELDLNGKHYVLVHAGVDPEIPLEENDEEILAWIREYFYLNEANPDYTYIFGHTPCCFINEDHSFNIWYDPDYHNKIAIDGGLAVGNKGQLNCLCLTTGEVTVLKYDEGQPQ